MKPEISRLLGDDNTWKWIVHDGNKRAVYKVWLLNGKWRAYVSTESYIPNVDSLRFD